MRKQPFEVTLWLLILFTFILGGAYTHNQSKKLRADALGFHREKSAPTGFSDWYSPGGASWTTGGPYGGYANSLHVSTTNPDVIYAGTDWGVFKTLDAGATWTRTGFLDAMVWIVRVAPDNPAVVHAGTDDGLYKSEDGGAVWAQEGLSGASVKAVAIDPLDGSVLYAGTADYTAAVNGIFKSTDGGETWHEKLSLPHEMGGAAGVQALLVDNDNSLHIYAGVRPNFGPNLYRSTDGGDTWVPVEVPDGPFPHEVVALAMTPAGANPAALYAIIGADDVYKSADGGDTWEATGTPWISPQEPWALAVDPSSPNVVYAGTWYHQGNVYKSTAGGDSWSVKADGLPGGGVASIVVDPQDSAVVYAGLSGGGVYKSADGAESWSSSIRGFNNTFIEGLAVHPSSSNTVFTTIKEEGHFLATTANEGASWEVVTSLAVDDLGAVAFDPSSPATIWVGDGLHSAFSFYVYRSTDGGRSWADIEFLRCILDSCNTGVFDILVAPTGSDRVLVGTSGSDGVVARTTDGGLTWLQVGPRSTALAADPNDPTVVYSGKAQAGQVFRYTDVWGTWDVTEITPAGGIGDVRDVEVDSGSKAYFAASDGLWCWDGSNWSTLSGLPTDDVTALVFDRSTSPETIYVGTGGYGVLASEDLGSSWSTFNDGLGNLHITKLAISTSQPKILYAGTAYGGVWSRVVEESRFIYLPFAVKE